LLHLSFVLCELQSALQERDGDVGLVVDVVVEPACVGSCWEKHDDACASWALEGCHVGLENPQGDGSSVWWVTPDGAVLCPVL
jgi:hypothetical protein